MTTVWVFLCGASGAGKDSLLVAARPMLARAGVAVATRVVTRAGTPGTDRGVSPAAFERLRAAGGFAWHWSAHGLHYGIPVGHAQQAAHGLVLVNGSREHAATVAGRADVRVVLVQAPEALLAQRLRTRSREDSRSIAERLARNAALQSVPTHCTIDNTGDLADAACRLADYLETLA